MNVRLYIWQRATAALMVPLVLLHVAVIFYATRQGIAFRLEEPQETEVRPKSYAENFKFGRPDRWTH